MRREGFPSFPMELKLKGGSICYPERVSGRMVFLASDCGSYITMQTIVVDGGGGVMLTYSGV